MGRALSVFRSFVSLLGLGSVSSLLCFKFSALAAPLKRSCSALVLAALAAAVAGAQPADDRIIETVAGGGSVGDGGPAAAAYLRLPWGVAVDGSGNLYIVDRGNQRIRKVDSAGGISTVAGDGIYGSGGDGGPAVAARWTGLRGVAVDGSGNLYIADTYTNRIRKVDADTGFISTIAGDGTRGFGGDGGPAVAAQLNHPRNVAVDGAGNLYIADASNHRIRKVDAAGVISTIAGDGMRGFGGDGGPAAAARLTSPRNVAPDGAGNLYIADTWNRRIRKVDAAGVISTVAGGGSVGDGGAAAAAQLNIPRDVAPDGSGNLYIADSRNHRIRKVDAAGVISTVAGDGTEGFGGDSGPAAAAQLRFPRDVAPDGSGNLYIADASNHRIRKVDAAGVISTVAGDGTEGFGGDGGPAAAAQLRFPWGVAPDGSGNLYIADASNHRIRKVDAAGVISTVAGDGTEGFGGDGGPAVAAQLRFPRDVAPDGSGNLYIADSGNYRIRKVDAAGVISTIAGDGTEGFGGDGGPAAAARLTSARDVAVDGAGNLYIADSDNHRIRKVDAAGGISTVAGGGTRGFGGDGGPAAAARLSQPWGVALDGAGNLYIADSDNHRIRKAAAPAARIPADGIALATGTPAVNRISPNAIISVFGQNFAPQGTLATYPALNPAGRVTANLAATCLEIGGKRAPLFFVSPTRVNAQVPHDLAPGEAALTVTRGCGTANEQRSAAASATVAAVSPAFFNLVNNADGRNPLVALHGGGPDLVGAPGLLPGAEFTPAAPGEVVTLYGTGFGPTEPAIAAGRIPGAAANLTNAVAFAVGGMAVPPEDVLYAGASPCCAGLYQFTVRLPADVPDGDATVTATVQGVSTPEGPYLTVRRPQ